MNLGDNMIKITIGSFEYEFENYATAIDFLQACDSRENNPDTEHEHVYDCAVNSMNFCMCGKVEE
jgi:hypothetical protein